MGAGPLPIHVRFRLGTPLGEWGCADHSRLQTAVKINFNIDILWKVAYLLSYRLPPRNCATDDGPGMQRRAPQGRKGMKLARRRRDNAIQASSDRARRELERNSPKNLARQYASAALAALVEALKDPKQSLPAARALLDHAAKSAHKEKPQAEPYKPIERFIVYS